MIKIHPLAKTLLILLLISGCSQQASYRSESGDADQRPGTSTGITVFGDARLGAAIG